ncbi:hypothetical protein [Haloferax sp. Atlit-12N]|uniref:hypothetical protein n=1 Tax=Haloferax sp. Atlit-12N TaxID=2077203 RepID=UPI0011E5DA00|nr:hypothetical protein [Haloferax sp. Atlit-12N]
MADKWTKLSALATIIFIGIPTAAGFYPPLLAGFADQLLVNSVLGWMRIGGVVVLVLLLLRVGVREEWFPSQDKKDWLNRVERTANGVQNAWEYSGNHPDPDDRKRTVEKMNERVEELEKHRNHQKATEEMKDAMGEIISDWRDCRDLIASAPFTHYYSMRALYIEEEADRLKELLEVERQSLPQRLLNTTATRVKNEIERVRRTLYGFRSKPLPYEVYKRLQDELPKPRLQKITSGAHYLFVLDNPSDGAISAELVSFEEEADEEQFNIYQVRHDYKHSPISIDTLQGYTVTTGMLLTRLEDADLVDTIPVQFFTPSGHGLKVFEDDESAIRHPDPREEPEKIVGCIETDGILWRGFADLTSDDGAAELDVDTDPKCPDCQTDMEQISGKEWECLNSNCGYSASTELRPYKEAESLFKKHIERILNSNDEEYSLENLIENIDGEVTGDKIWRRYHEVVDDEEVSIDCFH